MGFVIRQGKDEVQAARRFQVNAELRDVQLLDCTTTTPENMRLEDQFRLGMKMEQDVLHVSEGQAKFAVRISVFGYPPNGAADEADQRLFQIISRYALVYDLRPGYVPPKEELDAFKDGNAVFHCWPYTRELVQSMTMRMGLQIPPLPFLRLAPKQEPKKAAVKRHAKPGTEAKSK